MTASITPREEELLNQVPEFSGQVEADFFSLLNSPAPSFSERELAQTSVSSREEEQLRRLFG